MRKLYSICLASFVLLSAASLTAYVMLHDIHCLLVLHFDVLSGIDFLGTRDDVYKMLGTGVIIYMVNSGLAISLYNRERFLAWVVGGATLGFMTLLLITTIVVVVNN